MNKKQKKENSNKFAALTILKTLQRKECKCVVVTSSADKDEFLSGAFDRFAKALSTADADIEIYSCDENSDFGYIDLTKGFSDNGESSVKIKLIKGLPLLSSPETLMFAMKCDGVILVEKYAESNYRDFEHCLDMLKDVETDILGIIALKN